MKTVGKIFGNIFQISKLMLYSQSLSQRDCGKEKQVRIIMDQLYTCGLLPLLPTCASCGELSSGSRPSPVPSLVPCGWGEVLPRLQGSMSGPLSPSCWMSVVRLTDIFLGGGGEGGSWGGGWVENPGVAERKQAGEKRKIQALTVLKQQKAIQFWQWMTTDNEAYSI